MRRTLPSLCLLTLLTAAGCATDRAVIGQANQVHSGLQPAVLQDPQLAGYLQSLGDRILSAARTLDQQHVGPDSHRSEDNAWMFSSQMKFHFVNSKTLNAFTTGGDHMYIYTELFQQCKSEDELAAVMAHEYAHVYCRHVHKGMDRQKMLLGGALLAGGAGYAYGGSEHGMDYAQTFAAAAAAGGQFIGMSYTRSDEAQADELGFAFYTRAGWDPNHFGDFFQHMIDKGYDTTPGYLSDHPTLASRVQAARQRASQMPPGSAQWRRTPTAPASQFAQLQARAAQLAKTAPNDESLKKAQLLLAAFPSCVTADDSPDRKSARAKLKTLLETPPPKK